MHTIKFNIHILSFDITRDLRYDNMLAAQSIRLGAGKTSGLPEVSEVSPLMEWLKGDLLF